MRTLLASLALAAALAVAFAGSAVAAAPPGATTLPAGSITQTGATLNGTVDPQAEATSYFFEYGTTTAYGLTTGTVGAGDGAPVDASAAVTGLTANTTYHFRLVAVNASGRTDGADMEFRTSPNPLPPTVANQRARDIGIDVARLTATVDPNGNATTVRFEWGTSTRYGNTTPEQAAGSGTAPVLMSAPLAGLSPRTTYHWRTIATNAAGTVRGRDRSFTTARLLSGVSLSLSPARVRWGRGLSLGGRVSGTGVSRTPMTLQAQRWPFSSDFAEIARTTSGTDGGYLFQVANLWENTRYRVVTRTAVPAVSPVVEARSAVVAGARARHVSRRRARIEGSALPAVTGLARLQRRALGSRRWSTVSRKTATPSDAIRSRYRFSVRRFSRVRRYRVVVTPVAGSGHVVGYSRTVRVRARPR